MKKLIVLGVLEYDDEVMHGEFEEGKEWFINDVLKGKETLVVHSNLIGDDIGTLKVCGTFEHEKLDNKLKEIRDMLR